MILMMIFHFRPNKMFHGVCRTDRLDEMFPDIMKFPRIGFDTETTGLRYMSDRMFGFSVATPDGNSYYWDVRADPKAIDWFNDQMDGYAGTIIAHNASFDYRMAVSSGMVMPVAQLDDTAIRACLLDEHLMEYGLDFLAMLYLGEGKISEIYGELSKMFGGRATRNAQMKHIPDAPPEVVGKYAKKDAELTLRLWEEQELEIDRQEKSECPAIGEVMKFEKSLMPHFIEMEMRGIRVDLAKAEEAADKITPVITEQVSRLNKIAGCSININSSPQIRKLFDPQQVGDDWVLGNHIIPKTDSGAPSFNSGVLRSLQGDERAELIISIRSLLKTRDTFLRGHVLAHAVDDRIYPTINQSKGEDGGTSTGRISIRSPAMQQIPSRNKKVAAIVKPVFLPDEGQIWVDADEASHEVRVFAHLLAMVGEKKIVEQYDRDPRTDFHQFVADLTGLPRNATYSGQPNAKQLNLSCIFNSGNGSIADAMGLPWAWDSFIGEDGQTVRYRKAGAEAMRVIGDYHAALPGVKRLANKCKSVAESRGFIYTRIGRRIRFPDKRKTYKASGLLIQATAADFNKENIKWCNEILNEYGGRLILNIHDSYSLSCPQEHLRDMWRDLKGKLEDRSRANVPLLLDLAGVGENWWEALSSGNKPV
jgi:DNA polymerase I-like protein with 3'-5' exonuclease and polymerase domains